MTRPTPETAPAAELTYEQWLVSPVTNLRHEIVDGVVQVLGSADFDHQGTLGNLAALVDVFLRRHDIGLVVISPADVVIRKRPKLRVRQPDLMVFLDERAGFRCRPAPNKLFDDGVAPAVIFEVFSPGESEATFSDRLDDLASIGVPEAWLVDPFGPTIEVLNLRPEGRSQAGIYGVGEMVSSPNLPGLVLAVEDVFAE